MTIKDVARESGFSIATVSRILSGKDYAVNEATKSKVVKCAAEMGYQPNIVARSLRTNISSEIAVVIPSFSNPFYTDALNGIENELSRSGYNMVVYINRDNKEDPENIMNHVLRRKMAGVIITNDCVSDRIEQKLSEYQKEAPVVLLDSPISGNSRLHGVYFDYRKGARLGVEYLINKGHRSVALITRSIDRNTRSLIAEGYREAVANVGNTPIACAIFESEGSDDYQVGAALAEKVLESDIKYTGILANNDAVASGAIAAFVGRGVRVPEDISVIGIDDNVFSRMTSPLLTTVHVPSQEMGALAAKCVIESISGQSMQYDIYMPSSIVERNSVSERTV